MENKKIQDRLRALRDAMREAKIDYYLIPTADFHGSEYVSGYFKVREYFCNFSGSNGTLLVWQEGAGLWTDGRYFIQAERELAGTGVELFRMMEEGVPKLEDFLADQMQDSQTLGFDGRVINVVSAQRYEEKFAKKNKKIKIVYDRDLAGNIWKDRPDFPRGRVMPLEESLAGKSVEEKLSKVRMKLREEGADALFLSKLDDLMWLFNIRGCDVECNPVAMSYGYITQEKALLFLQKKALEKEVQGKEAVKEKADIYLSRHGVLVEEYDDAENILRALPEGQKILVDRRYCSFLFYRLLQERHILIEKHNPTELFKAVKNPVELANMEKIYLKDSVALTKFIYWLKTNIKKSRITEVEAAEKLEELRRQIPEFLDLSFPTIAAYGANAAMMHYEALQESCAVLEADGFFLVDSGGQYLGGTTDVTRTIALGPLTDEMKRHYTAVANAMLQLSGARWLYGCTGRNLDILARQPLWDLELDYKCGTGHGVGYLLNVHEGPQSMRWRYVEGQPEAVLEEGMDITNEPGVYLEGKYGIRIENVMVAKNDVKNEYGQFMHFETLTWVPLDRDAIDEAYLTREQRARIDGYQRRVFEKISPFLSKEEREWLQDETRVLDEK